MPLLQTLCFPRVSGTHLGLGLGPRSGVFQVCAEYPISAEPSPRPHAPPHVSYKVKSVSG